jgi:hypothetical protein
MRALAPEKGTRMKSLGLYRQMDDLYRLRALVDGINREALIAESKNGVNAPSWKSSRIFGRAMEYLIQPCIRSVMFPEQRRPSRHVKLTAALR